MVRLETAQTSRNMSRRSLFIAAQRMSRCLNTCRTTNPPPSVIGKVVGRCAVPGCTTLKRASGRLLCISPSSSRYTNKLTGTKHRADQETLTANHCWRLGWEDANTELSESARRNRVIAVGREEEFTETWGTLYDIGGDARVNGTPSMSSERKRGSWAGST